MNIIDYISGVYKLSDQLLDSHSELLARKEIVRRLDLIQAIKVDLNKIAHALVEVKENPAPAVLRNFFADSDLKHTKISRRLENQHINHIGFEIHEPLELVLYGIRHWIEQSRRALGAHMHIREFLCFPASQAFQDRVGAYAEIMRIWLDVGPRVLMLELFDIYRPAKLALAAAPKPAHRNFNEVFSSEGVAAEHELRFPELFAGDDIWHYAFHARSPRDVDILHSEMTAMTARSPGYVMAYAEPVHNRHDRSYHTKLVKREAGGGSRREIEFVTEYPAVPAV